MFIVFLCPFTCCLVIVGIQISILNAADLTDRFLGTGSRTTGMLTAIAALKAYTIFPFVRVLRYNGRITAIIYRTVCGRCLDPGDNTCVVSWDRELRKLPRILYRQPDLYRWPYHRSMLLIQTLSRQSRYGCADPHRHAARNSQVCPRGSPPVNTSVPFAPHMQE